MKKAPGPGILGVEKTPENITKEGALTEKDTRLVALTQAKIGQYAELVGRKCTRPERKCMGDMVYGLLKTGKPQLGSIGRSLGEAISVKKRTERLSRHLRKVDLHGRMMEGYGSAQRAKLSRCEYLLVDLTDVTKEYATRMEGQAGVYDGSAGGKGYGYNLVTITGVGTTRSEVVPAYEELYSLSAEVTSENEKILDGIHAVYLHTSGNAPFVMDRGADRGRIIKPLMDEKIPFIIRMTSKRDVWVGDEKIRIWKAASDTKLSYEVRVVRRGKNREKVVNLLCGARLVRLTKEGVVMWLVSAKYTGRTGGRFYFLTNLTCETQEDLIRKVVRGYHMRWIIEEVHREIKDDLNLEAIRLFDYHSIKNMSALVWITAGFYYTRLAGLESMDILLDMARSVVYRLKLKEITGFIYYKLFAVVSTLLKGSRRIRHIMFPNQKLLQLSFL